MFSGDKLLDRLSKSKNSALNTYTYEQHQMDSAGCIYIYKYMCVIIFKKEVIRLRERECEEHGRSCRGKERIK